MDLISFQTQPFQNAGKEKNHACVKTRLGVFLLNSKRERNRWGHVPSIQVDARIAVFPGARSHRQLLPPKRTARWCRACSPFAAYSPLKGPTQGCRERCSHVFEDGPGHSPRGPMCVVLFYSRKAPGYSSDAPLSFSTLPVKLAAGVSKCRLLLVKPVVPGRKSGSIHGFPLQCGAALSPPGEALKVQGSKPPSQGTKRGTWWLK